MRFMIMVRAHAMSERGTLPDEALMAEMGEFHEQLAQAGVLLDANGLRPSREGWRVRHEAGRCTVVDGPFAETRELIAGYTLIQVSSPEEALEWSRRFPAPFPGGTPCEIEVRRLFEPEDVEPGDAVACFREMDASQR